MLYSKPQTSVGSLLDMFSGCGANLSGVKGKQRGENRLPPVSWPGASGDT